MVRVPQKILVAPLDWGLGHATRCIPIIRFLVAQGHLVYLGITPQTAPLLQTEFPHLPCIQLPAYAVQYSKTAKGLPFTLLKQLPRIIRTIRQEHACLLQAVQEHGIQRILSDNRYGLWHPQVPAVMLIHQMQLQVPQSALAQTVINWIHSRMLLRFSACWIPDTPQHTFGGNLTQTNMPNNKVQYLGPLSRFEGAHSLQEKRNYTLVLLSGPEPQRTQLEHILIQQQSDFQGEVVLVRGTSAAIPLPTVPAHWTVHGLLHQHQLLPILQAAQWVVCRSGYSTLMDLAVLGKGALLVPTPGQTEQEYLAGWWAQGGNYVYQAQNGINIKKALAGLATAKQPEPYEGTRVYKTVLENWLGSEHNT
jgi:UDP:flavonoid glycosyltransferase YjiC (YdhE family)